MSEQTTTGEAPFWRPTEDGARLLMLWLGIAVGVIGALALGLSFVSVQDAARPYFGPAAWAIPVLMDATIGVLTFFSIAAELNRLHSPMARYTGRALVALTVYANVAPQPSVYGKILHGAPPTVWVLIVAVAENIIRRLMGLSDDKRIEALRKSLWLLRPVATWRIWRQMRIHQITTYADALDREAARMAVTGRLRLHHGRMWRHKAPLGERIALRLQGRDPAGVAAVLSDHADTVALLSAPAGTPAQDTQAPPDPVVDEALRPLDPVLYPRRERRVLSSFSTANALGFPFAPGVKTLPSARLPQPPQNAAQNAENDRDAAVRMRGEGLSIGAIADRLGRSKSWVHGVVTPDPVEHANGHARP